MYKDKDLLSDIIGDYLSDNYGFCHKGFVLEVRHNVLGEPSEVVANDIKWDVDVSITLDAVREYMGDINLDDYNLEGVEITEDDFDSGVDALINEAKDRVRGNSVSQSVDNPEKDIF